jgi:hypothetical protein
MTECKQENESPFEFYTRIQQLLNLQTSYIATHSQGAESVILVNYHRNLALRVLLRGLKDPLGSLMRTKNPADLNSALNMLTNDFQLESTHTRVAKPKIINKNANLNKMNFQNKLFRPNNQHQLQLTNFPHNPQFAQRPMHSSQGAGPSHIQNNYRLGSSTNQNVFKPGLSKNQPKPTAMSISTTNTYKPGQNLQIQNRGYRPNQNHFANNNKTRPNYIVEELYNIDDQPSIEMPDENCYDENAENSQNEFFQEIASENEIVELSDQDYQFLN